MKSIELKAIIRNDLGKKAAKTLRKKELIPCEIYGGGSNIHVAIEEKYLNKMVFTPYTYYAVLDINGETKKAIIKDVQFNPVTDRVSHVDFYEIYDDKPIIVKLPVKVVGLAKGVKDGGKLSQEMRYIHVKGLIKDMVEVVEINVENLELGKTIHAGDISIPNLTVVDKHDNAVVTVKITRAAVESSAEAGAAESAK
ncbi:MAG: 50S ribosomal protein L25 [Bacteroidales bacterium]|nr:50S ribosomal protein L25 [Bacteroidales bacterium]